MTESNMLDAVLQGSSLIIAAFLNYICIKRLVLDESASTQRSTTPATSPLTSKSDVTSFTSRNKLKTIKQDPIFLQFFFGNCLALGLFVARLVARTRRNIEFGTVSGDEDTDSDHSTSSFLWPAAARSVYEQLVAGECYAELILTQALSTYFLTVWSSRQVFGFSQLCMEINWRRRSVSAEADERSRRKFRVLTTLILFAVPVLTFCISIWLDTSSLSTNDAELRKQRFSLLSVNETTIIKTNENDNTGFVSRYYRDAADWLYNVEPAEPHATTTTSIQVQRELGVSISLCSWKLCRLPAIMYGFICRNLMLNVPIFLIGALFCFLDGLFVTKPTPSPDAMLSLADNKQKEALFCSENDKKVVPFAINTVDGTLAEQNNDERRPSCETSFFVSKAQSFIEIFLFIGAVWCGLIQPVLAIFTLYQQERAKHTEMIQNDDASAYASSFVNDNRIFWQKTLVPTAGGDVLFVRGIPRDEQFLMNDNMNAAVGSADSGLCFINSCISNHILLVINTVCLPSICLAYRWKWFK